jgi:putative sterol carrier protein
MAVFPSDEWVESFKHKLNTDAQYARIAKNWEGDVFITINPREEPQEEPVTIYFDLWHGKCRQAFIVKNDIEQKAAFILKGEFDNYLLILEGKLHPMQALLTRRLNIQGDMGLLMRNVPTVLDFVRCAQEVTDIPE